MRRKIETQRHTRMHTQAYTERCKINERLCFHSCFSQVLYLFIARDMSRSHKSFTLFCASYTYAKDSIKNRIECIFLSDTVPFFWVSNSNKYPPIQTFVFLPNIVLPTAPHTFLEPCLGFLPLPDERLSKH